MKRLYFILLISITLNTFGQLEKTDFTLEDVIKSRDYYAATVRGLVSMNDGLHYSAIEGDSVIAKYSYKTGEKVADLLTIEEVNNETIESFTNYQFNSDESKLIFYTDRSRIYRRSFTALYYVWDLELKKLTPVSNQPDQRLATLSPDGTKAAFVRDNNIYITDLLSGSETAVTTDGEFNKIINGAPDWVYEEEFEYNQAFDWSPNGKFLAYCKWDESNVPIFNMTVYEGTYPSKKSNELYPENYAFKYPKAGEDNSLVTVHSYHVESAKTVQVNVGSEADQYIPRLKWSPKNELVIYRLNRLQNHLEFLYANPSNGQSNVFYSEKNERYIDETYFDYLTFIDKGEKFIYVSERDGFLHLYMHSANGDILNQITKGSWDVTDYYGYNVKSKLIYFESAESSPLNRDVYAVKSDGTQKQKLSMLEGTNHAKFSNGFTYFINYYSTANTPTIVSLHNAKGKQIRVLEDNAPLKERLKTKNFVSKEFFTFKTAENVELNGWIIKPLNFDKTKKYPILMTQYSGPNSQSVTNSFRVGWEQVLAAEGYVVACVDGRGTGARGEDFRKITYLQLGKYETIDQIEAAKYFASLKFIDSTRIGIWGWSYGGFMTLNCMTMGEGIFKAGISVAPVTHYKYYDNIYTERFMRKPQDNEKGYEDYAPLNHADKLEGKLLLVHGTSDDNVHLQNSIEMAEALVQANKQFDMFYYTNRNHSIYGGNTRFHLYSKKLNFIKENL